MSNDSDQKLASPEPSREPVEVGRLERLLEQPAIDHP
jgi:hypothetical protein